MFFAITRYIMATASLLVWAFTAAHATPQLPQLKAKSTKYDGFMDKLTTNKVGKTLYKVVQHPEKAIRQAAGSLLLLGLESVDLAQPLMDGVRFIKQKTRFNFGECGEVVFRANRMSASSCLSSNGRIQLTSPYDLDGISLKVSWAL